MSPNFNSVEQNPWNKISFVDQHISHPLQNIWAHRCPVFTKAWNRPYTALYEYSPHICAMSVTPSIASYSYRHLDFPAGYTRICWKNLKNFTTRTSTNCVLCVSVNLTELVLTQYTTFNSNILYYSLTGPCNSNTMNTVAKPVRVCLEQCRISHRLHHHKGTPEVPILHPHYKAGRRIRMGCMFQYFSFSTFHLV
jgi:hypothetical protein